ncbi:hypothetical protein R5R35_000462 [Gryllus longicercus]|uniref:C2H2-type domain-containing protein n=1 Tax=Gryllus longicercus TaxID=2509291 RepID=A0AAN9VP65_9ORTH
MSNGDGEKRLNCLICTHELSVTSSFSVFYTVIPHSGHLLAHVIQKVLRIHVEQAALPSTFVCKKCFTKFQEYDRAEEKCNNVKKEILKIFNNNCEKHEFCVETTQGVACQTDDASEGILPAPVNNVGVKLELRDSCDSNDDADEESQSCQDEDENPETKKRQVKRKSQPTKKAAASPISEKGTSIAKADSVSPEKSQTQSEGERSQGSPSSGGGKFEIRTKDARRRRRYVHPCALCGRLFRRPCEVKQHLLSHGGAKPYKCQLCHRRFGSKSGAGIHALKKHGKDVTVENIIEVCNDIVPEGGDGGFPPENIKHLLEQNMKEEGGKDRSDGSDSSDGDDDFEWKLENEEELFGGGNVYDDDDSKHNMSGHDTTSQPGGSEIEGDTSIDLKERDLKTDGDEKAVKDGRNDKEVQVQKENDKKLDKKTKGESSAQSKTPASSANATSDDGRKKRKRKKRDPLPKVPKHKCPICGKMWRTMSEFKSHVNTHSDERPYICEICGQAYKHKAALDIHVGMHNGINPFCCPYCNKAFTQKGALQRHMPIHTGEAPFQCELCGKRFVHHTSFNMHTLAHTGQKSYKCQVCGLALLSGSHLKRHSRVHTGERPYQCTTCGKRFAERYNLVAHTRVHDPLGHGSARDSSKKLHKCQLCGAGFDRRPKLEDHLALSHNKISDTDDSRKWVGHLITTELGGPTSFQTGQPHPHTGAPAGVSHAQSLPGQQHQPVPASGVGHPPPLVPGANHVPAPPDHHHHHQQQQPPQHHHPQPPQPQQAPQPQQQPVWHHVLFGKGPDAHVDTDQHRLLSEMSALGAGLSGPGRGVLSSCLAGGHPSLGSHPHHMSNPHALAPATRLNMFGADASN